MEPERYGAGTLATGREASRFFLGLGEEGGGPIYLTGSRLVVGPQRGAASPKPRTPIGNQFLMSLAKIQARTSSFEVRGLTGP